MKSILKSASTFGIWLVVTAICVSVVFINAGSAKLMSAIIMATLVLLPVRDWVYRLIVWGIQYIFSINPTIKKKLSPYVIVDNLDPTGDKKILDSGALKIIKTTINIVCGVIALFFLAFRGVAKEAVYVFGHNVTMFVGYFVNDNGAIPFIWLLASAASLVFTIMVIRAFILGSFGIKEGIFLGFIVVKHIANYFVFQYDFMMVLFDLIGIIIFFAIIALIGFIIYKKMS